MTGIDDFFAFARERHSIYLRRQTSLPEPWTTDPILARYRFTNVFRELDKTTVWFRENVRERMRELPDVLLATVVFRWFNKIETGEAIFHGDHIDPDGSDGPCSAFRWLCETGDIDVMRQDILRARGTGPYVTGAYIIKTPDGYNKLEGVLRCIKWFMEGQFSLTTSWGPERLGYGDVATKLLDELGTCSLEQMWAWLKQFPFLGDFMAYEIVTDLRHTALLDRAPDILTWANPGPGATRGIGRVHSGNKDAFNQHRDKAGLITEMRVLLELSRSPNHWPQVYQDEIQMGDYELRVPLESMLNWPSWEMRDVEHTLCEFDKYERARTGEGRPRGTFR